MNCLLSGAHVGESAGRDTLSSNFFCVRPQCICVQGVGVASETRSGLSVVSPKLLQSVCVSMLLLALGSALRRIWTEGG